MSFINEVVPQSDYNHPVFAGDIYWPDHYRVAVRPYKWTIDRDRDVFLTISCMGREDEVYFILGWKGGLIRIMLESEFRPTQPDGMIDLVWKLHALAVPKRLDTGWGLPAKPNRWVAPMPLETDRDKVIHTLKEALEVHGYLYGSGKIRSVICMF